MRRIAERERHRVELETAREIQSSILPDLPPQLNGVALAHVYQPATEVGGDFYDVLALEDGRLAVAVGDVAGHGVSSGLVMSMALGAGRAGDLRPRRPRRLPHPQPAGLPERPPPAAHHSHLRGARSGAPAAPLRERGPRLPVPGDPRGQGLRARGGLLPVGVRAEVQPAVRLERLEAGDSVVLLSDSVVEAHPENNDEPFGFVRLADSLGRHAAGGPQSLLRGILADLALYTRGAPREDDVTVVALRLPE